MFEGPDSFTDLAGNHIGKSCEIGHFAGISPDEKYLLSGHNNGFNVTCIDDPSLRWTQILPFSTVVDSGCWFSDSIHVLICGENQIEVWNALTLECKATLKVSAWA
jgi:hypothetical protein